MILFIFILFYLSYLVLSNTIPQTYSTSMFRYKIDSSLELVDQRTNSELPRGKTPGARFPKRRQAQQVGCETEIGERAARRVPQMLSPITDKSTNYLRNATTLTKNAVNLSAPGPTTRDRPLLATVPQLKHLRQPATTTWQAIVERWAELWGEEVVYEDLQSINTNLTSYRLEMGRFLDRAVVLEVYEDLHQPTKRIDMLREGLRIRGIWSICSMCYAETGSWSAISTNG